MLFFMIFSFVKSELGRSYELSRSFLKMGFRVLFVKIMNNIFVMHHFTKHPFVLDTERVYHSTIGQKPKGLWLSDENSENSWSCWCISENFGPERMRYKTRIDVDTTGILIISNIIEMKNFNSIYGHQHKETGHKMINWELFASNFDGIIITPYLKQLRFEFDFLWYNGWDCASGCVWNLNCIKKVQNECFRL